MPPVKIKKEITPKHLRCYGGSCPAVYELDDGNLLIIGKTATEELTQQIKEKIADHETTIIISPSFFDQLNKIV